MTPVRLSPYVKPLWRALDELERAAIVAAVPPGHFISVIYRTSLTDLTVRLYRQVAAHTELVAMREHQRDIAEGCWAVLRDAAVAA